MHVCFVLSGQLTAIPGIRHLCDKLDAAGVTYSILPAQGSVFSCDDTRSFDTLYLTDNAEMASFLEQKKLPVLGYETTHPLPCKNIFTSAEAIDIDYLLERYSFLRDICYCYYTTDTFRFCSITLEEALCLYPLHQQEPYYLPKEWQNLNALEIRTRHKYLRENAEFQPLLRPYIIRVKENPSPIGNISLVSTPEYPVGTYTIEYYIHLNYRGNGLGAHAIAEFLQAITTDEAASDCPDCIYALIHRENHASLRVMAKLNKQQAIPSFKIADNIICYRLFP